MCLRLLSSILPKLMKPLANLRDEDGGVKPYTDVAEAARRMIDAANLFITVDDDDPNSSS